jgi:hypothetical protein
MNSGSLRDVRVSSVGMALAEGAQPFSESRQMSEVHKPGGIVKTSGIYKVVKEGDGATTFEVTCVEGEHFPTTRSGKGAHYELVHAATHSHKHEELGSKDS